jgi:hypothetical protein
MLLLNLAYPGLMAVYVVAWAVSFHLALQFTIVRVKCSAVIIHVKSIWSSRVSLFGIRDVPCALRCLHLRAS